MFNRLQILFGMVVRLLFITVYKLTYLLYHMNFIVTKENEVSNSCCQNYVKIILTEKKDLCMITITIINIYVIKTLYNDL